jgi:hypothetical protein
MQVELGSQADKSPIVDDGGMWAWLLLEPNDFVALENWDLRLDSFGYWVNEVESRGRK